MSLRWYQRQRLLVLGPNDSVLEAARAIEENGVGAVVVQEQGRVAGIATDRDLLVRVLGRGLDPKTTRLGEVMTAPVATLSASDSQADAIRLMRERHIRRIPLVEGERVVGMVTFDDLVLDEAASLADLAAIVQGQIGEGGPVESDRTPARRRSSARAMTTLGRMVGQVRTRGGIKEREQAEAALSVVLSALVRRLTPGEAKHLIAQLPSLLQPALRKPAPDLDKSITRATISAELKQRLGLDEAGAAKALAAIGAVVAESVTTGQMDDVRGQLPEELRGIFTASAEVHS